MEFSRQEHWSGLPFPSPGDLANPGVKPQAPPLQADSLLSEPPYFTDKEIQFDLQVMWCPVSGPDGQSTSRL